MNRLKLMLPVAGLACAVAAYAQTPPSPSSAGPAHELTREQAKDGAEKLFAAMDVNHDGKLDDADRMAQVNRMFDQLDTNHDGSLSRDEFLAAHKPGGRMAGVDHAGMAGGEPMGGPGAGAGAGAGAFRRERAFGMGMQIARNADPQHTGVITHDAFIASALALFDKADTNHDGKVTAEERRAAMPQRGQWGGGRGGMGGQWGGPGGMGGMGGPGPEGGELPPPPGN